MLQMLPVWPYRPLLLSTCTMRTLRYRGTRWRRTVLPPIRGQRQEAMLELQRKPYGLG